VSNDDALVQKAPESQPLPTFIEPRPAPAAAIAPAPVAPTAGNSRYHVLAKGETLYALSRKYNVKVNKIMEANQFKDPNHLAVGTKVYIPN
jgi:LysM repeat protein